MFKKRTGDLGDRQGDRETAKPNPALKRAIGCETPPLAPGMRLTVRWDLSGNTGSKTELNPIVQQNPWSLAIRYHKPNKSGGGGHRSRNRSYLPGCVGRKQGEKEKVQS